MGKFFLACLLFLALVVWKGEFVETLKLTATPDQLFFQLSTKTRSLIWDNFVHEGSAFLRLMSSINYPFAQEVVNCTWKTETIKTLVKAYFVKYPNSHEILFPFEKILKEKELKEEIRKLIYDPFIDITYSPETLRLPKDFLKERSLEDVSIFLQSLCKEPWKLGFNLTYLDRLVEELEIPSFYIYTNSHVFTENQESHQAVKIEGEVWEWLPDAITLVCWVSHRPIAESIYRELPTRGEHFQQNMHPLQVNLYNLLCWKDWHSSYDSILDALFQSALKDTWSFPEKAVIHTKLFLATCNLLSHQPDAKSDEQAIQLLEQRFYSLVTSYQPADFTRVYFESSIKCTLNLGIYINTDEDEIKGRNKIDKSTVMAFDRLFWKAGKFIGDLKSFAHAWRRSLGTTGKYLQSPSLIETPLDWLNSFGAPFRSMMNFLVVKKELFAPVHFTLTNQTCYTINCYLINSGKVLEAASREYPNSNDLPVHYFYAFARLMASNIIYRHTIGLQIIPSDLIQFYNPKSRIAQLLEQVKLQSCFPLALLVDHCEQRIKMLDAKIIKKNLLLAGLRKERDFRTMMLRTEIAMAFKRARLIITLVLTLAVLGRCIFLNN